MPDSYVYSDSVLADGLALLISRYQSKPNLEALLNALMRPFQELEDTFESLSIDRYLTAAVGKQLDLLGELLGLAREGRTDDDYRVWLRARVQVNRSSGTAPQIYTIALLVLEPDPQLVIIPYPTGYALRNDSSSEVDPISVVELIQAATGAGIPVDYWWAPGFDAPGFCFAEGTTPVASNPNGFDGGRLYGLAREGDLKAAAIPDPIADIGTVERWFADTPPVGTIASWLGDKATNLSIPGPTAPSRIQSVFRGGFPAVRFALDSRIAASEFAPGLLSTFEGGPFTLCWFGSKRQAGAFNRVLHVYNNATNNVGLFVNTSDNLILFTSGPSSSIYTLGSVPDTDAHTFVVTYDGAGTAKSFIDGVSVTDTDTPRTPAGLDEFVVGNPAIGTANQGWGDMAELAIIDRLVTDQEAASIHTYLSDRYKETEYV